MVTVLPAFAGLIVSIVVNVAMVLTGLLLLRTRPSTARWLAGAGLAGFGASLGLGGIMVSAGLLGVMSLGSIAMAACAVVLHLGQILALVMAHRRLVVRVSFQ